MHKVLILAPARYESSRFPGKPLAKIYGKPMIQYVVENCNKTGFDYSIVTDNGEIENAVKNIDGNCKIDYQTIIDLHETQMNCIFTHPNFKNLLFLDFSPQKANDQGPKIGDFENEKLS